MRSCNRSFNGPVPKMRSFHPGCSRATVSKAVISRSKPFWGTNRPTAITTGFCCRLCSRSSMCTAFGMRTTGVPGRRVVYSSRLVSVSTAMVSKRP